MKIYKIIAYIYLVFALFFIYDAYVTYTNNENYWLKLALAGMAIFMFIFRMRNINKLPQNKQ